MLNSEDSSGMKLSDILLAATLSFKLLVDACTVIRAVGFLMQAQTNDSTAATVADGVIDKVIDKINTPLAKLNEHINATKSFLDAAAQKQAAELLSLQEAVKQQADLINSLADASGKATQAPNPRGLSDAALPLLTTSGPQGHLQGPLGPMPPRGPPMADPKVAQCVALASRQLLIDYGPLDKGEELCPKTMDEQRELRQLFNDWIDAVTSTKAEITEGQFPHPLLHGA